jgi:hypothetical protein
MNRRTFLSALSGSLLAAPLAAEGQQAGSTVEFDSHRSRSVDTMCGNSRRTANACSTWTGPRRSSE